MQGWYLPMNTCDVIVLQRAASPSSVCCCGVLARLPLGLAAAPPGPCRNSSDEGCPSGGNRGSIKPCTQVTVLLIRYPVVACSRCLHSLLLLK